MAIKSGELLQVGNQVLIDRAQTGGPGNLNIPTEKIYELGNYESVATIRDVPDLTFDLESLDVSAEIECMLTGRDFTATADGTLIKMANVLPLDVASQFKAGRTATNPFDVVASVAVPYLVAESVSYRFGLRDNASQSISLRGDAIFYATASAFVEVGAVGSETVTFPNAPLPYNGDTIAGTRYALGVSLVKSGKRLTVGTDYTETAASVVVTETIPADEQVRVIYQSQAATANYPQASHAAASATRPAAIRGRDIEVRVGGALVTDRWSSIQSVTVEQRLTLEKDEEFGNPQAVGQDFDVPAVTGSIELKPRDTLELLKRIRQIAGIVSEAEVVGPQTSAVVPIQIILHSPDNGAVLKTIEVPDARFTLPGFSGQANSKLSITLNFESDGGVLNVYKGAKA
jgi:hypothetical protein